MQCYKEWQLFNISKAAKTTKIFINQLDLYKHKSYSQISQDRQPIQIDDQSIAIYINCSQLFIQVFERNIKQMNLTKTKLISKKIKLSQIKQMLQRKFKASQKSKVKLIKKEDLLRVSNIQYTQCLICCRPMIKPVTLNCGHTCCLQCIEEGSLTSGKCSFCKKTIKIKQITINRAIQSFVKGYLAILGCQHINNYIKRQKESLFRENQRMVDIEGLEIGDTIDYREPLRMKWFKGNVMQIEQCKDHKLIYVEFAREHQSSEDFEIFQSFSMNIAASGFFSKRTKNSSRRSLETNNRINHSNRTYLSPNIHHLHP